LRRERILKAANARLMLDEALAAAILVVLHPAAGARLHQGCAAPLAFAG